MSSDIRYNLVRMAATSSVLTVTAVVIAGNIVGSIAGPIVKETIGIAGEVLSGAGRVVTGIISRITSSDSEVKPPKFFVEIREKNIEYLMKHYRCSRSIAEYILDNDHLPATREHAKSINENSDWVFVD